MAAIQMATTMEAVESNFLTKLPRELRDAIYEFYAPNRHFHIPLRIQSVPVPAGPFKHVTVEEPLECVIGSHCGSDKFPTPEQAGVQRDYYGHALAFINKQTYTEYTDVQKGRNADFHSLHIAAPVHGLVEDVPVLMKTLKAQGAPVPWNAKRLSICLDFTNYFTARPLALFRRTKGESVTIDKDVLTVFKKAGDRYPPGDNQARTSADFLHREAVVDDMLHLASKNGTRLVLDLLAGFDKLEVLNVVTLHHLPAHEDNIIAEWAESFRREIAREVCYYIREEREKKRWGLRGFTLIMENFEIKECVERVWREEFETYAVVNGHNFLLRVPRRLFPFQYHKHPYKPDAEDIIAARQL